MLRLENVRKYNEYDKPILNDINLDLPRGEITALIGPNGAGKTTLMKCILGFEKYSGSVTLDGEPIQKKTIEKLAFATHELSFFPNLTCYEHEDFYQSQFPTFLEHRYKTLMDFFELSPSKRLSTLSAGQKSQYEVILALSQGADYILMDEPFTTNDMLNREDFYKLILGLLKDNETILMSTHLVDEIETFISRAILMDQGKIVADYQTMDLDEDGHLLTELVKEHFHYAPDRVRKTLSKGDV